MNLSKTTLEVIKNFNSFLSLQSTNSRKMRLTPDLIEFKISGIIGFYFCKNQNNGGFQELIISDSKRFIDVAEKIGFENADFKDPYIYLKKGDRKIKFHTSDKSAVKPIDKEVITFFDSIDPKKDLLIEPFNLDLGDINDLFDMANTLGYKGLKLESKNNTLKLITYDLKEIDGGYDELNLNIKTQNKIEMSFSLDIFRKLAKSTYKVYVHPEIIKLENLDINGLNYYLSPLN